MAPNGSGWVARCPAHDDDRSSLSVHEGDDGRILLKCFAGCSFEAVVAALGLKPSDLMGPNGKRAKRPSRERIDLEALARDKGFPLDFLRSLGCADLPNGGVRIPYRDPDGQEAVARLRYALRAGDGSAWPKGSKPIPYGLDRLAEARKRGGLVLVEGESDAWTLWRHDIPALGIPGADMARILEAAHLEGIRRVYLTQEPDRGGETFRRGIAARLRELGWSGELRAVQMQAHGHKDPNAWHKTDPTGFLAAFQRAAREAVVVDAAELPTDKTDETPGAGGSVSFVSTARGPFSKTEGPQPLPEALPAVPPLALEMLPEAFGAWVGDVADRMQCPPDFPAAGAMVALSAVVGRQIGIRPKRRDDWTVTPNLWGGVVGRPSTMKSPALREVMKPLERLEALAREAHDAATREHDAGALVGEQAAKAAKEEIRKALKRGDDAAARSLALSVVADDGAAPERRRYVTNDTTIEKLGELLAANPRGVLVYRDELVGLLRNLDKEGQEGARAFYLEAWNGAGRFTFDRIGRGTVEIEAACLSVFGGIQPGPLQDYLRATLQGGTGDDGLLQRFQVVVWPDSSGEWRNVDRWPDSAARRNAWAVFERLDRIDPRPLGAEEEDGLPFVRFSPEAQEAFDGWRATLERRLRADEEHPAFEAHLAKYRSLVPSLALLSHLADGGAGPVGIVPLAQALAWGEYLEAHARRLYAPALEPGLQAARELDRRILRGDLGAQFTARDVYRRGWRLLDPQGTARALDYLTDLERVLAEVAGPGEEGGRPSVTYHVHPALLGEVEP
ncbi:MAG: DUF3987 domain-containing protein [Thermodesulfobacteriota bacterium]